MNVRWLGVLLCLFVLSGCYGTRPLARPSLPRIAPELIVSPAEAEIVGQGDVQ